MERYRNALTDVLGQPIGGVSVTVRLKGTSTAAPIYSDNGVTPKANPFTGDANGSLEFYAPNGRYTLLLAKTGATFDADDPVDILLHDPLVGQTTTPGSTGANTTETTLQSLTLPAYGLNYDGQEISARAAGTTAANANVKTVRLKVGGTTVLALVIDPGEAAAKDWWAEARITRLSASAVRVDARGGYDGSNLVVTGTASLAVDLTAAATVLVSGQNGTASASDITSRRLALVEP